MSEFLNVRSIEGVDRFQERVVDDSPLRDQILKIQAQAKYHLGKDVSAVVRFHHQQGAGTFKQYRQEFQWSEVVAGFEYNWK